MSGGYRVRRVGGNGRNCGRRRNLVRVKRMTGRRRTMHSNLYSARGSGERYGERDADYVDERKSVFEPSDPSFWEQG